jgi:very-short-patch-repair endonuclease
MSATAMKVLSILNDVFPANPYRRVYEEHYVNFKGQRLFFDFYVKELGVFIEVQGRQHVQFVKHFHGDAETFKAQKYRDNLKVEYVQTTGKCLVRIYDTEDVTKKLVLNKISKAMEECFYE